MNNVRFEPDASLTDVLVGPTVRNTMLNAWFDTNSKHTDCRHLTYCDFKTPSTKIGRMYYVHPSVGELYYLCMLLMIVKGERSYDDVRMFNTRVYSTFHEACEKCGLHENDNEWNLLFDEAIVYASSYQLRQLFVMVVLHCLVTNVCALFDKYWLYFTDDIQRSICNMLGNSRYVAPHEQLMSLLI
jgi:hypothetical protein